MIPADAPTWLEVDLSAIHRNVTAVCQVVGPGVSVIAVAKANGYGHGLVQVGRTLERAGVDAIAVALVDEATQLRDAGVTVPILVLTSALPGAAEDIVRQDITCVLCEPILARALSRAAVRQGRTARIEIKVDTGMGRLGVYPQDLAGFLEEIGRLPGLKIEGIFSHLSCAEEADPAFTLHQIECFQQVRREICDGWRDARRWRWHLGSSAAAVRFPECRMDAVRVGLLVYGLNPAADLCPLTLQPALTWKARIAFLKDCPASSPISYGRTFVTDRSMKVATLGIGYADGYPRSLSNEAEVLVGGQRAKVIGRICMDQMMIALPVGLQAAVSDEVVLLGAQGEDRITTEELALKAGTILHEILARLGTRMPRVYSE